MARKTREELRQILIKDYPPFLKMSPQRQEELLDCECYIEHHAPELKVSLTHI